MAGQRQPPRLYLHSPDPQSVEDERWLSAALPGTQAVYEDSGRLWLSAQLLLERDSFAMPEDARGLIEGVYGEDALQRIPEPLQEATLKAQGILKGQRGMGAFNCLRLEKGYTWNSAGPAGGWDEDTRIPTRLGADSSTVALAWEDDGALRPYAGTGRHRWAMSQLNLPRYQWESVARRISPQWCEPIERLKAEEPALRWCEVLPLVDDISHCYSEGGGWNDTGRDT